MTKPVVLCVLDGWGYRPNGKGNAIAEAETPCMDLLFSKYPHTLLQASEGYVGLPEGQMGNSEVGHANLGAGRVVMQDLPRINKAVNQDTIRTNKIFRELVSKLKNSKGACHVMGLLSPGGVHSHQHHFEYIVRTLAREGIPVAIHGFLDGRDTPPKSAKNFVQEFIDHCDHEPLIRVMTLSGRYYAMDRDNRWERTELAYNALVSGEGPRMGYPIEVIQDSYTSGVTDEFLVPTIIGDYHGMHDGDTVLMINFRADRARQILTALVDPTFTQFDRSKVTHFNAQVGMVSYSESLDHYLKTLFEPLQLTNTLGEVISKAGLRQLRIAETEKYAHVTFFFNGGEETLFEGEDRILVPSPKVATYDLHPEMSAYELTDKLIEAIESDRYSFIVVNYANTDMVGHTGDEAAAIMAVEAVDKCLESLSDKILEIGGVLLITADHGNAEVMINEETGQPHTAHTLNPVPLIIVSDVVKSSLSEGVLADVAPTILEIMGLPKPDEMTGRSLLDLSEKNLI